MSTEAESLSPAQYARQTGLTLQYVYSLLASGRLEAERKDGRWLIAVSELEKRQQKEAV